MTRRLTAHRLSETARFRARIEHDIRVVQVTSVALAAAIGVTPTMVGYWRQGRYLPSLARADQLADYFSDPMLLETVRTAMVGRCLACPRIFPRNATRRLYCSAACRRDYHKGVRGPRSSDPRQGAIDAFCRGCEPMGLCRDDLCDLRAFSPLPFVPLHRIAS